MSRKHNTKKSRIKSPVQHIVVTPAVRERKVLTNPETGAVEIVYIERPEVVTQGRAHNSTRNRGLKNEPPAKGGKR